MLPILLFLQTQADAGGTVDKIIVGVVTAVIVAVVTYFLTRPKTNSEITLNIAQAEKNRSENYFALYEKLSVWIERFETAKEDAVKLEDTVTALKRELDSCIRSKDSCKEFKEKANGFFTKIESAIKEFADPEILKELKSLQSELMNGQNGNHK
jgi:gas vesicle protein